MQTPAEHEIKKIYSNLHLEVSDREAQASGKTITLFFDTLDAITAALGMHWYTVNASEGSGVVSREKLEAFRAPAALVDCLLASGWLGTFRLLPPHQAEFLRKLDSRDVFQKFKWPDPRNRDFLRAVGLYDEKENSAVLETMTGEDRKSFIRKQADSADRFFKAFECIHEPWWKRLGRWRGDPGDTKQPLFDTQPLGIDYRKLIASDDFAAVLKQFETDRQSTYASASASVNNFADAVALTMLIELARRFNDRESNDVPRFFDSKGTFRSVARRAKVEESLQVCFGKAGETPVLVEADYLIYKATFNRPPRQQSSAASRPTPRVGPEEIYGEIGNIIEKESEPRLKALDEVHLTDGRLLGESIDELLSLSFLRYVWLEELAEDEMRKYELDYHAATKEGTTDALKKQVASAISDTREALKRNADEYRRLSAAWLNLQRWVVELRKTHLKSRHESFDPIRDWRLVRFAFPLEIENRVRQVMYSLLDPAIEEDEITDQEGWHQLVDAYIGDGIENAQLAAAALWPMHAYGTIVELLQKTNDQSHAMRVIYAAAHVELGSNDSITIAERILGELVACFKDDEGISTLQPWDSWQLGQRAIGIAYLYFHIWEKLGYSAPWRKVEGYPIKAGERGRKLVSEAVQFAGKAVRRLGDAERGNLPLDDKMQMELVYAKDQLLYYLVEQGDSHQENAMEAAARDLESLKRRWGERAWMATYHDSLARYHHFCAVRSPDEATWRGLLDEAIKCARAAVGADPADVQATDYHGLLLRERRRGFQASSGPIA